MAWGFIHFMCIGLFMWNLKIKGEVHQTSASKQLPLPFLCKSTHFVDDWGWVLDHFYFPINLNLFPNYVSHITMTSLKLNIKPAVINPTHLNGTCLEKYAIWNLFIYPGLWCHRQQTGKIYRNVMLCRALQNSHWYNIYY